MRFQGPVYQLQWSPFDSNLFMSCSADWTLRIWDHVCMFKSYWQASKPHTTQHQIESIITLQPSSVPLNSAAWSGTVASILASVSYDESIGMFSFLAYKISATLVRNHCTFSIWIRSPSTLLSHLTRPMLNSRPSPLLQTRTSSWLCHCRVDPCSSLIRDRWATRRVSSPSCFWKTCLITRLNHPSSRFVGHCR